MLTDWTPPNDYDEARARRLTLIAEIEEIDAQLLDQAKKSNMGKDAWNVWRTKAIWAKVHRSQDLRLVKQWLYDNPDD
jgi:hypothetical protein